MAFDNWQKGQISSFGIPKASSIQSRTVTHWSYANGISAFPAQIVGIFVLSRMSKISKPIFSWHTNDSQRHLSFIISSQLYPNVYKIAFLPYPLFLLCMLTLVSSVLVSGSQGLREQTLPTSNASHLGKWHNQILCFLITQLCVAHPLPMFHATGTYRTEALVQVLS